MKNRTLLLASVLLLIRTAFAVLPPGDNVKLKADWFAMNEPILPDGMVNAIVTPDSTTIYAAGNFGVITWNGTAWRPLGTGVRDMVYSLALDGEGNLYAAGNLKEFGYIARWDGSAWSALGSGLPKVSQLITVDRKRGRLYAAGYFDSTDGIPAHWVKMWDGTTWTPLWHGSKFKSNFGENGINCMTVDSAGNLYVGGSSRWDDKGTFSSLMRWDGKNLTALGDIISNINAIGFDRQGVLWISSVGVEKDTCLWEWDGLSLRRYSGGLAIRHPGIFMFDSSGSIVLTKEISIYTWGLYRFNPVVDEMTLLDSFPLQLIPTAMSIDSRGILFTAEGNGVGGTSGNIGVVKKWSTTGWIYLRNWMNQISDIEVDVNKNIFVCGDFTEIGGIRVNGIAQWTGTVWRSLDNSMNCCNEYNFIASDQNGMLYVGGDFDSIGNVPARNLAKWNGSSWEALGEGVKGIVSELTINENGTLFIVENSDSVGSSNSFKIVQWTGVWSTIGDGLKGNGYSLICDHKGNLYVGTYRNDLNGGTATSNILWRWDGTAWFPMDSGLSPGDYGKFGIGKLAIDTHGDLYASGTFTCNYTLANGNFMLDQSKAGIAVFRDGKWGALGDFGVNYCDVVLSSSAGISSIVFDRNNTCYAGGYFNFIDWPCPAYYDTTIPYHTTPCLAIWSSGNWKALRGGFYSSEGYAANIGINCLAVIDSFVLVGGNFDNSGAGRSPGIVKMKLDASGLMAGPPLRVHASQEIGFSVAGTVLHLSGVQETDEVALYSLVGRRLLKYHGSRRMNLSGIATQPLFIEIRRNGMAVKTGLVMR